MNLEWRHLWVPESGGRLCGLGQISKNRGTYWLQNVEDSCHCSLHPGWGGGRSDCSSSRQQSVVVSVVFHAVDNKHQAESLTRSSTLHVTAAQRMLCELLCSTERSRSSCPPLERCTTCSSHGEWDWYWNKNFTIFLFSSCVANHKIFKINFNMQ